MLMLTLLKWCMSIYMSISLMLLLDILLDRVNVRSNFFCKTELNVLLNNIFSSELLGKILSDDTALKEYKIDEKNFVVVMVTKVSFVFPLYRYACQSSSSGHVHSR